jgi:hypothetical protein
VKPEGAAYFCEAAVGWRVQEPLLPPLALKDNPANNGPTVAGTKENIGNDPVAGLLPLTHTLLTENHKLPAEKSIAIPYVVFPATPLDCV